MNTSHQMKVAERLDAAYEEVKRMVDEFRQSEEEGPLEKAINDQGRRGPSKIFRSGAGASVTRRVIRIDCQAMVGGVTAAQETQSSSR